MNRIHILCATDNKYAPYCGIMLTSLFMNAGGSKYHVYIFADQSLSTCNRMKFSKLGKEYSCSVEIIEIDNSLLADCPVNTYTNITLPTYYRLLAPKILPKDIHRVIYLDCDMIIKGSLSYLWNIDLTGKAIAGVVDCEAYNESIYERLDNYTAERDYFNAGVTVYNLDMWREQDISQQAFEYINKNAEKLYWMDQDVLNVLLQNLKVLLPMEYNYETIYFLPKNWLNYSDALKHEILNKSRSPIIIHYNGPGKPWNFRYYGAPFFDDWDTVRKKSLWKHSRVNKPFIKYIKYLVKRYIMHPFLQKQIQDSWIVLPENQHCYHV